MAQNEFDDWDEQLSKIKDTIVPQLYEVIANNAKELWVDENGSIYPYGCLVACLETALRTTLTIIKGADEEEKSERAKMIIMMVLTELKITH